MLSPKDLPLLSSMRAPNFAWQAAEPWRAMDKQPLGMTFLWVVPAHCHVLFVKHRQQEPMQRTQQ